VRNAGQLRPILPRLHALGGSHAQRDLFEQVYLDAWLRAEQNHQALQLLEKRVAARRYVPLYETYGRDMLETVNGSSGVSPAPRLSN